MDAQRMYILVIKIINNNERITIRVKIHPS